MDKLGATYRPPRGTGHPEPEHRHRGRGPGGARGRARSLRRRLRGARLRDDRPPRGHDDLGHPGVPRSRPASSRRDVERLMQRCPGLEVHLDTALGRDVSLEELKRRHDAVLLTIGAWWGKPMGIAGEEDERVVDGVGFLRRVNAGERPEMPETVVVVGGGDVAMDACRVAKRLPGCKHVKVIYRPRPRRDSGPRNRASPCGEGGRGVPLPHPAGCGGPARQPARAPMREDRARRAGRGRTPPARW